MDEAIILIICMCIIFVFVILLLIFGGFNSYKPPQQSLETSINDYLLPSAWKPTEMSSDNINNACNTYTFLGQQNFYPPNVKFTNIIECTNSTKSCKNNTCICTKKTSSTLKCIDSDQLFAYQNTHVCTGVGDGTGDCISTTGQRVPIGTSETFYSTCSFGSASPSTTETISDINQINTNYCFGAISILAFNVNTNIVGEKAFTDAMCIDSQNWSTSSSSSSSSTFYTNLSPLMIYKCNTTKTYNGYPSQLFRIQRASYNGTYKESETGSFCRIVQRPSNYYLYPALNSGTLLPIPGSNITVQNLTDENLTYCWYLLPNIPKTTVVDEYGVYLTYSVKQQIIYVPKENAGKITQTLNTSQLFSYIINNNVYSIQPPIGIKDGEYFIPEGYPLILDKILIYSYQPNSEMNNKKCELCTLNYYDYAILPTIIKEPSDYTFYG